MRVIQGCLAVEGALAFAGFEQVLPSQHRERKDLTCVGGWQPILPVVAARLLSQGFLLFISIFLKFPNRENTHHCLATIGFDQSWPVAARVQ